MCKFAAEKLGLPGAKKSILNAVGTKSDPLDDFFKADRNDVDKDGVPRPPVESITVPKHNTSRKLKKVMNDGMRSGPPDNFFKADRDDVDKVSISRPPIEPIKVSKQNTSRRPKVTDGGIKSGPIDRFFSRQARLV